MDDIEFEKHPMAPWYDVPDPMTEWKEFHGNVLELYLTPKCMYYNVENSSWQTEGVKVCIFEIIDTKNVPADGISHNRDGCL